MLFFDGPLRQAVKKKKKKQEKANIARLNYNGR